MIVSYSFLFSAHSEVGAGDLATGPYAQPLSQETHTLITNMFNDMVNGSLPVSVLKFPAFFTQPETRMYPISRYFPDFPVEDSTIFEFNNVTLKALRNYHYLWHTYFYELKNFTLFCLSEAYNCTVDREGADNLNEKYRFQLALYENGIVNQIRENPNNGMLVEGDSITPPCSNYSTIKKFEIHVICNFLNDISKDKVSFLKLMKYSKQGPVFTEEDMESLNFTTFGYTKKKKESILKLVFRIFFIANYFCMQFTVVKGSLQ